MQWLKNSCIACLGLLLFTTTAGAHFGMIIPSDSMITAEDPRTLTLNASFSHPFELLGMTLSQPAEFFVIHEGKKTSVKELLSPVEIMGKAGYRLTYPVNRPGVYVFGMEPTPYFEPAEDCFIVHFTKTVVAAFGDDEGWDAAAGFPTEIIPLSKPFGLYAGNLFQGIVTVKGAPVPHATVEVEYYNRADNAVAPTEYMITQTIKADRNGVFSYAAPVAGWWGFAALTEADETLLHEGVKKNVELGAVLWVEFVDWQTQASGE